MKRFVFIIAALLSMLSACSNPDPVREALLKRSGELAAPKSVTYDGENSAAQMLAVYWDGEQAIKDGAVSFEIQVSTDEFFFSGEGGTLITKTLGISSSPNDAVIISGLTAGQEYFLRVAAVYPGPSKSEWAYLSNDSGKTCAVIPGKGLVE